MNLYKTANLFITLMLIHFPRICIENKNIVFQCQKYISGGVSSGSRVRIPRRSSGDASSDRPEPLTVTTSPSPPLLHTPRVPPSSPSSTEHTVPRPHCYNGGQGEVPISLPFPVPIQYGDVPRAPAPAVQAAGCPEATDPPTKSHTGRLASSPTTLYYVDGPKDAVEFSGIYNFL